MRLPRHIVLLLIILLTGAILRCAALSWNSFPHADVTSDAEAALLLSTTGKFLVAPPDPSAVPTVGLFRINPQTGIPLLQHGPVWPMLGASAAFLWNGSSSGDMFLTLRWISFLVGLGVMIFLFVIARRIVSQETALFVALWASLSALLIDYSGNGAFYIAQALLYLLWLWILLWPFRGYALCLGAISGITYLLNYQAIILFFITPIAIFFVEDSLKNRLKHICIASGVAALIASPWLLRNLFLFGDPFAHHLTNLQYVFSKAGVFPKTIDGLSVYPTGIVKIRIILDMIITSWLPNNTFYIARKLFILAPIAFIFFCYGAVDQLLSPNRRRAFLPLLLLFAAHALISACWPVTKFRYFVPLLPLVFLLSAEALEHYFPHRRTRLLWCWLITGAIALCSLLTFLSVPTHTYYFDGAITTDPFSGRGEWNYLRDNALLPSR